MHVCSCVVKTLTYDLTFEILFLISKISWNQNDFFGQCGRAECFSVSVLNVNLNLGGQLIHLCGLPNLEALRLIHGSLNL
jgi:hypothetical protein